MTRFSYRPADRARCPTTPSRARSLSESSVTPTSVVSKDHSLPTSGQSNLTQAASPQSIDWSITGLLYSPRGANIHTLRRTRLCPYTASRWLELLCRAQRCVRHTHTQTTKRAICVVVNRICVMHAMQSKTEKKLKPQLILRLTCRLQWVAAYRLWHYNKGVSHTRTVVRECCRGDDESLWTGKIWPPPYKTFETVKIIFLQ